jgi:hypothetical protein
MTLWRILVAVPDDPTSRSALDSALAGQSVPGLRVLPGQPASAGTSEIVVDLPHDGLATVLSALHEISPQVFVSRADTGPVAEAESPRARYGVLSAVRSGFPSR